LRSSAFFHSSRLWRYAIVLGTVAIWPIVGRAMDPDRALSQYLRDRWEKSSGFTHGPVYGITQTRDGYLWIAAEKGVVRFDGLRFRLFQPLQPTATTDTAALGVLPDPDGGLWTGLRRAALMRLRNGAFENALSTSGPPESWVGAMALGNNGAILIADTRLGVIVKRAGRDETVLAREALPRPFVTAIAQTPDGDIWLGTRNAGLVRVQSGRAAPAAGVPLTQINCLIPDDRNGLWIGTEDGIFRWDGKSVTRAVTTPDAGHARALAMVRDRDANLWVGTADGLVRIDPRGVLSFERRESSMAVTALFEDREGNLWVGDTSGIERWRDGVFASYATVDPVMTGSIGPVFSDATDRVWFAPASGGLYWLRDGRVGSVAALRDDVIYSIAGDAGAVLVGRQRGGMTRVRAHGDTAVTFTTETFTERDGLAQNQVFAVHRARDGAVWAGTIGRGASRLKDGAVTTYTTKDGLASNTVAAVLEAANGATWFATPNGASVKSSDGWRRYSTADGLPSNDVNTLFEDSATNLWVGTAAGLAVMHGGRMQSIQGVPAMRASVLGLAEDRAGGLWIAATGQVLRVDREKLLGGTLGAGDLREFSAADGLIDTEAIKRHRILTNDSRGRIWLATNGGLVMADSRRIAAGIAPALVHVEEVSADGTPVEQTGTMTIPPRPERMTFGFAALSLSVPDRVRFRYRLDGFDHDWNEPVAERQAVFTNLGPGSYRFRVIASNSEGVWNSAEATLPFTIAPAWGQMGSFWAAIALIVAGGIWGGYRMRLRQLARQLDLRFDERLAERSRIARELHDTLLQSFQGALLRFRAVTYMLPDRPAEARETLEHAIDQARQAVAEGRDAVQGLRSPAIATNDIAVAIATLAETLSTDDSGQNPPVFHVNVEGTPRDLPPIVQDEVYRIAGEALRNAFRHAHASRIEVEIHYDQRRFRLRVRDDGKGIDSEAADGRTYAGHYGLAGMQERAKLIGGTLSVWSERDSGTEAELTIPASVAYARSATT
jgi:signal transduction histidine kinase/ligand-binding sensor domain-containing protein